MTQAAHALPDGRHHCAATATTDKLIVVIEVQGGPAYEAHWVNSQDKADGGDVNDFELSQTSHILTDVIEGSGGAAMTDLPRTLPSTTSCSRRRSRRSTAPSTVRGVGAGAGKGQRPAFTTTSSTPTLPSPTRTAITPRRSCTWT